MTERHDLSRQTFRQLGILMGRSLVGLTIFPLTVSAIPTSLNPCPRIYYEEPFNSTRLVPQGCPPNFATQTSINRGQISGSLYIQPSTPVNVIQPPLPSTRQNAIATITPIGGEVSVQLQNDTNAQIYYQAIGYTDRRVLTGGTNIVLQNLPTPVTLVMTRQDGGFLKVQPLVNSQSGLLSVSLDEATSLDNNQGTLRIQPDGQVFAN